jgi:hypothetical protein
MSNAPQPFLFTAVFGRSPKRRIHSGVRLGWKNIRLLFHRAVFTSAGSVVKSSRHEGLAQAVGSLPRRIFGDGGICFVIDCMALRVCVGGDGVAHRGTGVQGGIATVDSGGWGFVDLHDFGRTGSARHLAARAGRLPSPSHAFAARTSGPSATD